MPVSLSKISTIALLLIAIVVESYNPYIFPSEISLFLDELDNLPIEFKYSELEIPNIFLILKKASGA